MEDFVALISATLRYYTHPEQLDLATFLCGDISENDKKRIMREKYAEILKIIDNFIATTTKSYPNRTQIVPKSYPFLAVICIKVAFFLCR